MLVEAIAALKAALAPAIPLPQLIKHGPSIALSLRVKRLRRPLQLKKVRQIFDDSLG